MDANYSTHKATPRWLRSVASLAVAALFSSAACAQDIPAKPVNLRAVQQDGYVTLTWDRLAKDQADTLLTEGFEGKTFPEGWKVQTTNTYDPTYTWFRFPTPEMEETGNEEDLNLWRHTGKGSAVVTWDQVGEHEDGTPADQDEWLILPATKGAQYLNFYTAIDPKVLEYGEFEDFKDHYYVKVSHDGGKTWKALWDARYDSNGSDDWQLVSLYLGDASEGDAIVAFQALSDLDDEATGLYFTWAIDDVSLYTEATGAAAPSQPREGKPLASLPAYRPFAMTGKKVARPMRSAYKVTGATSYNVLIDGQMLAQQVKTTAYTDTTDKASGEYTYGVQAVNGDAVSEPVEVKVNFSAPRTNAPRNVQVTSAYDEETGKYKVNMTWDAPEGDRQPSHYECYANGALFAGWLEPDERVIEQTGVNRGVQYYAVKAVYENPDGESELVGTLVAIGTRNTVSDLQASIDEDNATAHLTWQAPKASEYTVEKYLVFRGGKQIAETKATSYDDTNIPEGDYEYNVKTVYTDGFVSLPIAVAVSYGEEIVYGLPFNEDFNSGLLPADWAVERINESMKIDYVWRFDNWYELPVSGGGFEGNFASICSSISPLVNMFAALETPCLYSKLQADEKVFIDFDIDYCTVDKATGQKSEAGLKYSYNKNEWADVCDAFDGYHVEDLAAGETCKPQHLSFDVTSCFAENSPLYFAWFYNAKKAQHIAIDNVKIYIVNGSGIQSTETTANQADAPIYSLSGQRVAGDRSSLQPGVYVQNGKKIVVK